VKPKKGDLVSVIDENGEECAAGLFLDTFVPTARNFPHTSWSDYYVMCSRRGDGMWSTTKCCWKPVLSYSKRLISRYC